jgi:hypothetical protein
MAQQQWKARRRMLGTSLKSPPLPWLLLFGFIAAEPVGGVDASRYRVERYTQHAVEIAHRPLVGPRRNLLQVPPQALCFPPFSPTTSVTRAATPRRLTDGGVARGGCDWQVPLGSFVVKDGESPLITGPWWPDAPPTLTCQVCLLAQADTTTALYLGTVALTHLVAYSSTGVSQLCHTGIGTLDFSLRRRE